MIFEEGAIKRFRKTFQGCTIFISLVVNLLFGIKRRFVNDPEPLVTHLHEFAKGHLEKGDVETAWRILMQ